MISPMTSFKHNSEDIVLINELELEVRIGCTSAERRESQRVLVSGSFWVPAGVAARSGRLEDTVCYATLSDLLGDLVSNNEWKLVETFLEDIAQLSFESFAACTRLELTAEKFTVEGARSVGVKIARTRQS